VLPTIDPLLIDSKAEAGEKDIIVRGGQESNEIVISAPRPRSRRSRCGTSPSSSRTRRAGKGSRTCRPAKRPTSERPDGPKGPDRRKCWRLVDTEPKAIAEIPHTNDLANPVPGCTTSSSGDRFRCRDPTKNWEIFVPTSQLLEEMGRVDHNHRQAIAVLFHCRLTRPILGMLLVFMAWR